MANDIFYPDRIDKIAPQLFISGAINNYSELVKLKIKYVINLRAEHHDDVSILSRLGIAYFWIPIGDWGAPRSDQVKTLLDIWRTADRWEKNILIHCSVGIGRAPCMAMAILMSTGYSMEESISMIHKARPEIRMLPTQVEKVVEEIKKYV